MEKTRAHGLPAGVYAVAGGVADTRTSRAWTMPIEDDFNYESESPIRRCSGKSDGAKFCQAIQAARSFKKMFSDVQFTTDGGIQYFGLKGILY